MKKNRLALGISLSAASLFFGPVGIALIMALQVAPLPPVLTPLVKLLHSLTFVFTLVWFAIAVCSPALVIAALFKTKLRIYLAPFIIVWIVSWMGAPIGWSLHSLRKPGRKRMALHAKPVSDAIESYHTREGKYPNDLSALVPTFLPEIPHTGAVGYPNFKYSFATDASLFRRYELMVDTSTGGINWDVFVFWPEKNYPKNMYGGGVERIDDWAYVHE